MIKESIKVTIFGKNYLLSTGETSKEEVQTAAEMVDALLHEAAEKAPSMHEINLAVLTSLQLAADLTKARKDLEAFKDDATHLASLIENELVAHKENQ